MKRTWTDKQLIQAVADSLNIVGVIRLLGLTVAGGNHKSIKSHILRLNLNTSHFSKENQFSGLRSWIRTKTYEDKEIFIKNSKVSSLTVRRRARKTLLPYKCNGCGVSNTYNNLPLNLELDHINGTHNDNRIVNLRWMCPNCHSQTENFGSKNR